MWGKNLLRGFIAFLFIFPISALAALTYQPSNTSGTYASLSEAETAMNQAAGFNSGTASESFQFQYEETNGPVAIRHYMAPSVLTSQEGYLNTDGIGRPCFSTLDESINDYLTFRTVLTVKCSLVEILTAPGSWDLSYKLVPSPGSHTICETCNAACGTQFGLGCRICPQGFTQKNGKCYANDPNNLLTATITIADTPPPPYTGPATPKSPTTSRGEDLGEACPMVGDPINPANGNLFETESDYISAGPHPLEFKRYYNSRGVRNYLENSPSYVLKEDLGLKWRHTYMRTIAIEPFIANTVRVIRHTGKVHTFTFDSAQNKWIAASNIMEQLQELTSAGQRTGWRLITDDDSVEDYDATGILQKITQRDGYIISLNYTNGFLTGISDSFGRQLTLHYKGGLLESMNDPAGQLYQYFYNIDNNVLVDVIYPDGGVRHYDYNWNHATASFYNIYPDLLTAIIDENGNKYAQWRYDDWDNANDNRRGEFADVVNLTYSIGTAKDYSTATGVRYYQSTNPNIYLQAKHYVFTDQFGKTKVSQIDQGLACPTCPPSQIIHYDANGFLQDRTDAKGNVTNYIYNARGLQESRTEAVGTIEERTINTTWDSTFHIPLCKQDPMRTTVFEYDAKGRLLSETQVDTTNVNQFPDEAAKSCGNVKAGLSANATVWNTKTTSYTYYTSGALEGLIHTINGPLPPDVHGVDDITTFIYDNTTSPNGAFNLTEIQRPYGLTTRITEHDAHGHPLTIVDANGLITKLTYTKRGWIDTIQKGNDTQGYELTDYDYDKAGNLTYIALPDGETLYYIYDTAHRLTDIYDGPNQTGNHIHYTLDITGNRTETTIYDPNGVLKRKQSQVFNDRNLLQNIVTAAGDIAKTLTYDDNGNIKTLNDSLNITANDYDALNRLKTVTDAKNGITTYGFDAQDHVTSVTDPKGANATPSYATLYDYDGLGNLKSLTSPDTGLTTYSSYDAAGHLLSKTDVRGITTTYTYDNLGRLTSINPPNDSSTNLTYDACPNGKGRLCSMTHGTSILSWEYDIHGRVSAKTQAIGSLNFSVQYRYDPNTGKLASIDYPSGKTLVYGYKNQNIDTLTVNGLGSIMTNGLYDPFGPLIGWSTKYIAQYQSIDLDGHVSDYTLGINTYTVKYNLTDTISDLLDNKNTANNQSFDYDALLRLTDVGGVQWFDYDDNNNRILDHSNTNTIDPFSNKLLTTNGVNYTYDSAGNIRNNGLHDFSYNDNNQLISIDNQAATYDYNGLNQRITKHFLGTDPNLAIQALIYSDKDKEYQTAAAGYTATANNFAIQAAQFQQQADQAAAQARVEFLTASTYAKSAMTHRNQQTGHLINADQYTATANHYQSLIDNATIWTRILIPLYISFRNTNLQLAADERALADQEGNLALADEQMRDYYRGQQQIENAKAAGFATQAQAALDQENKFRTLASDQTNLANQAKIQSDTLAQQDKTGTSSALTVYFVYDEQGHLIGEYQADGSVIQEYVWNGDKPMGMIREDGLYNFGLDQLNTPRSVFTNGSTPQEVWHWKSDPFGNGAPNEDMDGDGINFHMNLRFAGQYYDVESGLDYNWNRYYDPRTGRYISFDPLDVLPGLTPTPNLPKEIRDYYQSFTTQQIVAFGLNHPFAYVENNPLMFTDPFGLNPGMGGSTNSCAHYDMRCAQSGGTSTYYCSIAPLACNYTPPSEWTGCVRQCLQDFDKACGRECDGSPNMQCTVEAHAHCWLKCGGL